MERQPLGHLGVGRLIDVAFQLRVKSPQSRVERV